MREKYTGKSRGFGFVTFRATGEQQWGACLAGWQWHTPVPGSCATSSQATGAAVAPPPAAAQDGSTAVASARHVNALRHRLPAAASPLLAAAADALKAVNSEHSIDGRKCEAKYALPEGKVGVATYFSCI